MSATINRSLCAIVRGTARLALIARPGQCSRRKYLRGRISSLFSTQSRKFSMTLRVAFWCAFVLLLLLRCSVASAVVVAGSYAGQSDANVNNTSDSVPTGFNYWSNVGQVGSASGVYIGDDWVMTAAHTTISSTTFSFNDPQTGDVVAVDYGVVSNSGVRLTNPSGPGAGQGSDIFLYKIDPSTGVLHGSKTPYAQSPNLDHVFLGNTPVAAGKSPDVVVGIGRGMDRQDTTTNWDGSWNPTPSGFYTGYSLTSSQQMRWGDNKVFATGQWFNAGTSSNPVYSYAFQTKFDASGNTVNEFQATPGDSGGGAFRLNSATNRYELVGMIDGISLYGNQYQDPSQPTPNTLAPKVVFGNLTYIADLTLSSYRNQILAIAPMPGDLNFDTLDDISDVQIIAANWLTQGAAGDANHDGVVDISDIQVVAKYWSDGTGGASGNAQVVDGTLVPEPATWALLSAALSILAGHHQWRRLTQHQWRRLTQRPIPSVPG